MDFVYTYASIYKYTIRMLHTPPQNVRYITCILQHNTRVTFIYTIWLYNMVYVLAAFKQNNLTDRSTLHRSL